MMNSVLLWNSAAEDWWEIPLEDFDAPVEPWHWHPGETPWWPLRPEDLDALAGTMTICPDVNVALGPRLMGTRGRMALGAWCDRWGALVGLCGAENPARALAHELYHAVWPRLPEDAREILEAHGDAVRAAYDGPATVAAWLARDGEAEAFAFDAWYGGARPPGGIASDPEVLAVWRGIRAGRWAV